MATIFFLVVIMIMSFRYEIVLPFFKIRPSAAPTPLLHETPPALQSPGFSRVQSIEPLERSQQDRAIQEPSSANPVPIGPTLKLDSRSTAMHAAVQELEGVVRGPQRTIEASTQVPDVEKEVHQSSEANPPVVESNSTGNSTEDVQESSETAQNEASAQVPQDEDEDLMESEYQVIYKFP